MNLFGGISIFNFKFSIAILGKHNKFVNNFPIQMGNGFSVTNVETLKRNPQTNAGHLLQPFIVSFIFYNSVIIILLPAAAAGFGEVSAKLTPVNRPQ